MIHFFFSHRENYPTPGRCQGGLRRRRAIISKTLAQLLLYYPMLSGKVFRITLLQAGCHE